MISSTKSSIVTRRFFAEVPTKYNKKLSDLYDLKREAEKVKTTYETASEDLFTLFRNKLKIDVGSLSLKSSIHPKNGWCLISMVTNNILYIAKKNGINTKVSFFDNNCTKYILNKFGKANVVYAANVMCHIPNIRNVFANIKKLIKAILKP